MENLSNRSAHVSLDYREFASIPECMALGSLIEQTTSTVTLTVTATTYSSTTSMSYTTSTETRSTTVSTTQTTSTTTTVTATYTSTSRESITFLTTTTVLSTLQLTETTSTTVTATQTSTLFSQTTTIAKTTLVYSDTTVYSPIEILTSTKPTTTTTTITSTFETTSTVYSPTVILTTVTQITTTITAPGARSCIIASAAYGSDIAEPVQSLREFRDKRILPTLAGAQFMKVFDSFYYSFSPAVASIIVSSPPTATIVRQLLYPLICILHAASAIPNMPTPPSEFSVVIVGLISSASLGITYATPVLVIHWALRGKSFRKSSAFSVVRLKRQVDSNPAVDGSSS